MGAAHRFDPYGIELVARKQKRRHPRATAYLCIDLCSQDAMWTGLTMNISEGGVFVATHEILPVGSMVALHLELPRSKRIMCLGDVRWSRDYTGDDDVPPGLGIGFVGLDLDSAAAIRDFVLSTLEASKLTRH
jgi:uncharacterized protein (TIGR02266 family)